MQTRIKIIPILMVLLLCGVSAIAQPDNTPGDPDNVPIDGGLSILVAAGVGYGAKKIADKRKRSFDKPKF